MQFRVIQLTQKLPTVMETWGSKSS